MQSGRGIEISKQGLDKRFNNQAVEFLQSLFERALRTQLCGEMPGTTQLGKLFKAIRIMDSTCWKLPANLSEDFRGFAGSGTASCAKIQFEYELLSGRIEQLQLQPAVQADKSYAFEKRDHLQAGELILRDLGYYSVEEYARLEERGVYYISRLKQQISIYEERKGKLVSINYKAIIGRLQKSGDRYLDTIVYIGRDHKHPVRLIANLLDDRSFEHRVQRRKHHKRILTKEDYACCRLNLFISNISQSLLDAEQVYRLYKIRWQAELIFKTWKSILKIQCSRKMKATRFKCYLYIKLLWIVLNQQLIAISQANPTKEKQILSIYKCFILIREYRLELIEAFFYRIEALKIHLETIYRLLCRYGGKEKRKKRHNLEDLLKIPAMNMRINSNFELSTIAKPSVPIKQIPMVYKKTKQIYEEKNKPGGIARLCPKLLG